jgi:hypothetical protein
MGITGSTSTPLRAHLVGSRASRPALKISWKMWRMRAPPASSLTGMCSLRPSSIALRGGGERGEWGQGEEG